MSDDTNVTSEDTTSQSTEAQTDLSDSVTSNETNEIDTKLSTEVESESEETSKEEIKVMSITEKYGDVLDKFLMNEMTDADYKALAAKGVSKEEFDMIGEALHTKITQNDNELYSFVGGEDSYREMQAYANETLSPEEQALFNEAICVDMKLAKLVVLGLKAQMDNDRGYAPAMRIEGNSTAQAAETYSSRDEYYSDKRNRSYGKDAAFTARVDAKRNASGF